MMGIERVSLLRHEGLAKGEGIFVGVLGALMMVLHHGPTLVGSSGLDLISHGEISSRGQPKPSGWLVSGLMDLGLDHFHLGVLCFIGNCMCMVSFLSIQAPLLKKYPANLSVTTYSYCFGALLMVITSYFVTDELTDWSLNQSETFAILYAEIIASALNYGIITWSKFGLSSLPNPETNYKSSMAAFTKARVAAAVGVSVNAGGWCCCLAAPDAIPFTIATRYSDVRRKFGSQNGGLETQTASAITRLSLQQNNRSPAKIKPNPLKFWK
ncbi:hypothetical protein KIW84_044252 [Lathyrus oleraceus]|uniref:WAT1-related protein n=1 Tax=Pisum sativum TaxID=3888 RepID=A0A9D4XKM2_PEA|nr:hypothetical protein KIW84_044252 [Pisum sativum]